MSTATIKDTTTTPDGTFTSTRTVTDSGRVIKDPSVAAAKAGTLTTRTNNTQGVITLSSGHGLTTGRVDVYWSGGARYGATGTVAGDTVTLTSGAGDNLPVQGTAMRVAVPSLEPFPVTAADMSMLLVGCPTGQNFDMWAIFLDGSSAVVAAVYVGNGSDAYRWDDVSGVTTPFGSDVAEVYLSHGATDGAKTPIAVAYID